MEEQTREVDLGVTVYDMNKNLVEQTCVHLKGKKLDEKIVKVIRPYFHKHNDNKYFMLLCRECADYTIFKRINFNTQHLISQEVIEVLNDRGAIYSIDATEDGIALELWIRRDDDGEMHCYYLFPYDNAIIEV